MIFYGRNVVLECLRSSFSKRTSFVYLQKGIKQDAKISEIISLAKEHEISLAYKERHELSKLVNSEEHQGVLISSDFQFSKLKNLAGNTKSAFIYISTATYEHNIGAIVRSAEVSGFAGVIIPKQAEITATVARTSVGAIFHIPIYSESIFNTIKIFKDNNYFIFGIERDGNYYADTDMTENSLFIIGGEDKSLSEQVRKKCDSILEIKQFGKVNSLNMSVAASIIMFERSRQLIKSIN